MDVLTRLITIAVLVIFMGIHVEGRTCVHQTMSTNESRENVTMSPQRDDVYVLLRRWYCRGHYEKPIYMYTGQSPTKYLFFVSGMNFTGWVVGGTVCSWISAVMAGAGSVSTPDRVERGNWKVWKDLLLWQDSPETFVYCSSYYNGWAVFGIVIGVILGLTLLIAIVAIVFSKCTKNKFATSPNTAMHNRDAVQQYPQVVGAGAGARTAPVVDVGHGAVAYDPYQTLSAKEQEAYGQPPTYSEVPGTNPASTPDTETQPFGGGVPPAYQAIDQSTAVHLSAAGASPDNVTHGGTENPVFHISNSQ